MSTTVILIKVEERRVQLQHREESFLGIEVSRSNVDIHLPAAVGEVGVVSEEVRRHTLKVAPRPIQWAAKMPSWPQLLECAEARLSGTGFRIAPQTVMRRGRALPTARHLHLLIFRVTARDGRMASCSIHCLHARFARVLRMQAAKEAKQCEPMHVHGLVTLLQEFVTSVRYRVPVKRHRGEPEHTRDTRDTRARAGTQITRTSLTYRY